MLLNNVEHSKKNMIEFEKIGFGTADLDDKAENAIVTALESGYKLIDTARAYGSEQAVGKAIAKLCNNTECKRTDFIVQTKLSPTVSGYYETLADFEQSLDLLQMDYIDVYFIHWPVIRGNEVNYHEKNIDTWKAFEKLYKEKKVKYLGICNFLERHLLDIFENCEIMPHIHQLELHPGYQQRGLVEFSRKYNMLIEAWSPMGRGVLNKLEYISMAERYGKNVSQLALRWCHQNGFIPLTRSCSKSHIKDNLDIFDFEITEEDMNYLNQLNTNNGFLDIWSYKRQQMY